MYYILKVLDNNGVYRPDAIVIGEVELRPPKSDYPEELKAIKLSIENNKEQLDIEFNSRIGIIVDTESLEIAEQIANEKFVEVLDIISDELIMSKINLSKSGYAKNLETGEIHPINNDSYGPGIAFMRATGKFQKIEFSQWIIRQETDLAECYRRSLHWSRNAKWEKNIQIQILFHWFAIEALFKKSEQDNVAPLVRWCLGYPNGALAQHVSPKIINSLKSNPVYEQWKTKITETL